MVEARFAKFLACDMPFLTFGVKLDQAKLGDVARIAVMLHREREERRKESNQILDMLRIIASAKDLPPHDGSFNEKAVTSVNERQLQSESDPRGPETQIPENATDAECHAIAEKLGWWKQFKRKLRLRL